MRKNIFVTLLILFILNACGSSSSSSESSEIQNFTYEEKQFVHNLFLSEYLWYADVPLNIEYDKYTYPQTFINALRVDPPDQWSFFITEQEYTNFVNQQTSGFGFRYLQDTFTIMLVRINAPAYQKLFRGDVILEIDNQPVTSNLLSLASQNTNIITHFKVLRQGNIVNVDIQASAYTFQVSQGKVLIDNNQTIGYLRYDSFTDSSIDEFESIFTTFKDANVSELIIDMRYNGGGSIATASALLDNITNRYPSQRQVYLDWNVNYTYKNMTYSFEDVDLQDGNELEMTRVFFLVTKDSASASELVISALKPYLGDTNVITIGSATHGKNVGMSGKSFGTNIYFLVNFYVRNNLGNTTSLNGIPATCQVTDDLTHLLGDVNESMLQTALFYIQTGNCL